MSFIFKSYCLHKVKNAIVYTRYYESTAVDNYYQGRAEERGGGEPKGEEIEKSRGERGTSGSLDIKEALSKLQGKHQRGDPLALGESQLRREGEGDEEES